VNEEFFANTAMTGQADDSMGMMSVDDAEKVLVVNGRIVPDDDNVARYDASMDATMPHLVVAAPIRTGVNLPIALLERDEAERLRARWTEIQIKFVDEPQAAVEEADALVLEVIEKITRMFTNEHNALESQWKQGDGVSTEELRTVLQHYRFFFNRLVLRAE
jgi:hypothetical protein